MANINSTKFNDCIIYYKSGDGESFINYIRAANGSALEISDEEREYLEYLYQSEIFDHDHDDSDGLGKLTIVNSNPSENIYSSGSY